MLAKGDPRRLRVISALVRRKRGRSLLVTGLLALVAASGVAYADTSSTSPQPQTQPQPAPHPQPSPPPEPQPEPFPEPQPQPSPQPQTPPGTPAPPAAEPIPDGSAPPSEPLPEPLFFGPQGPLYSGPGGYGDRIADFTDCPDGPDCRKARRAGVEAALATERAGGDYESQRIAAEATFLANLRAKVPNESRRTVGAFPTAGATIGLMADLVARGGRDAQTAARLQRLLIEAELQARGYRTYR
jgi:hypothetical protein